MAKAGRNIVVFDLGGVLIDWDPRHLYRKLFAGDEAAMEHFLATVCTHEWHRHHDAGRSFAEGARVLKEVHPDKAELIDAYGMRQDEMMAGVIPGTLKILRELRDREVPLYALSNWPAEGFALARRRFDFLDWFRGIVISGEIGAIKALRAGNRYQRFGGESFHAFKGAGDISSLLGPDLSPKRGA